MMTRNNVYGFHATGAVDMHRDNAPMAAEMGGSHAWRCGPSVLRTLLCGPEQGSGRDLTCLAQCTRALYMRVSPTTLSQMMSNYSLRTAGGTWWGCEPAQKNGEAATVCSGGRHGR